MKVAPPSSVSTVQRSWPLIRSLRLSMNTPMSSALRASTFMLSRAPHPRAKRSRSARATRRNDWMPASANAPWTSSSIPSLQARRVTPNSSRWEICFNNMVRSSCLKVSSTPGLVTFNFTLLISPLRSRPPSIRAILPALSRFGIVERTRFLRRTRPVIRAESVICPPI